MSLCQRVEEIERLLDEEVEITMRKQIENWKHERQGALDTYEASKTYECDCVLMVDMNFKYMRVL